MAPSPTSSLSDSNGEKAREAHRERADGDAPAAGQAHVYHEDIDTSAVDERKLLRKLDMALIPWLSFLYLLSFLDRTSIGNAKLYGMVTDLNMTEPQYNIALMIFFFSYAIFEVPSNVFLKRLRPSVWLSLLMLLWGVVMTVQGLVHNYGGLLGVRWMLGTFEAGLFPGVNFYLSCWYKRSEFGIRAAIFFAAATVSGAFGGLLAAAIANMDGVGGKPAWAWIFIIEGLVTVVAGALSFFIIQDFPDTARFLTEPERAAVVRRLQADDQFSAGGENLKGRHLLAAIRDWRTWVAMLIYTGSDGPLYAFSLFLPSIIAELGFKATPANLLTVPVYTFACLVTISAGFYADRRRQRGIQNIVFLCIALAGYLILVFSRNATLSYIAVFLAAAGIYPNIPNTVAWVSNNNEGSYKRGVALAMVISFGNMNGAVSSNIYRAKDKPWYRLGHGVVLAYIGIGLITSLIYHFSLRAENARRERGERDEVILPGGLKGLEGLSEEEKLRAARNGVFESVEAAKIEKGDQWSGYRYTI